MKISADTLFYCISIKKFLIVHDCEFAMIPISLLQSSKIMHF